MASSLARKRARAREQERARQRGQYSRIAAFGVIVILVIVAIGFFLSPVFAPKASRIAQTPDGKVVNIQAAMDGFDITEIRAKAGEQVTVNLESMDNWMHPDGGGKHQYGIDDLGVNIIAQPMSTSSGTFTPSKPGLYTYYCDICCGGKANPTMNGKLIVES